MKQFSLSDLLFKNSAKDALISFPEWRIPMIGLSGASTYSGRPASAKSKPKLNAAAYTMDLLLNGQLKAMETEDGSLVYVEYYPQKDKPIVRGYYTDALGINFIGEMPHDLVHACVPLAVYAFRNNVTPETRKTASNIFEKTPDIDDLLLLSDCFYYETKATFPSEISILEDAEEEPVKQAIRTGFLKPLDIPLYDEKSPTFIIDAVAPEIHEESTAPEDFDKFTACKMGDYLLNHTWEVDRLEHIPDLSTLDGFVPSEEFYTCLDLIHHELSIVLERMDDVRIGFGVQAIGDNYVNCQLVGRPGTGKTSLVNALGAALGMPVQVVINSKNTEEDTYQGMTKVSEGGYKFIETDGLDVYKHGGIMLVEEYNLGDPAVLMGALGQALEKPFIMLEDGYRVVHRNPLCVVIATMNTGTQGSREPSEALTSRMPHVFLLDDPAETQFLDILQKRSGAKKQTCKKVYKVYTRILDYLKSPKVNAEDVALSLTLRHCLAALKQMSIGRPFKSAIKGTMIGTIAIKDIDLAREVYDSVVSVLPD